MKNRAPVGPLEASLETKCTLETASRHRHRLHELRRRVVTSSGEWWRGGSDCRATFPLPHARAVNARQYAAERHARWAERRLCRPLAREFQFRARDYYDRARGLVIHLSLSLSLLHCTVAPGKLCRREMSDSTTLLVLQFLAAFLTCLADYSRAQDEETLGKQKTHTEPAPSHFDTRRDVYVYSGLQNVYSDS